MYKLWKKLVSKIDLSGEKVERVRQKIVIKIEFQLVGVFFNHGAMGSCMDHALEQQHPGLTNEKICERFV